MPWTKKLHTNLLQANKETMTITYFLVSSFLTI